MALMVRQTTAGQAWVARPNHALSPGQMHKLVLAAAGITGTIALAFAAFGAWPVLPFAGLEVAVLWFALRHLRRHADDEERLDVSERNVTVTRVTHGELETWEFPRYWARLRVEHSGDRPGSRLFLRSHGRELEIGQLLTDEQKEKLAAELRGTLNQSQ